MPTGQTLAPETVAGMVAAAKAFLGSLNGHQKAKATYEYMDGERVF